MKHWGDVFSGLGTVILSILSCAFCPLCLPFYAGLLSVIGIELGNIHEFFFPIMMAFSLITLGIMARQTYTHHGGWLPFKVAIGSAFAMAVFAFYGYEYCLYASLALFMGSIMWNKKSLTHEHGCC